MRFGVLTKVDNLKLQSQTPSARHSSVDFHVGQPDPSAEPLEGVGGGGPLAAQALRVELHGSWAGHERERAVLTHVVRATVGVIEVGVVEENQVRRAWELLA